MRQYYIIKYNKPGCVSHHLFKIENNKVYIKYNNDHDWTGWWGTVDKPIVYPHGTPELFFDQNPEAEELTEAELILELL